MPVESVEAWKKENGVEIRATYIGNHDDIQAKIASGGAEGADLITYYQGYKPLYSELGILHAIDESKLPNLAGLFPFWLTDIGGKRSSSTRTAHARASPGPRARSASRGTTRCCPAVSTRGTTCSTRRSRAR